MNGTTFFKTSDFKGLSKYPEDVQAGIISYLDSLNGVLNNIDYWDWKPIFPTVVKPLYYSLNQGQNPICKQWNKSIPRNQMLLMDSRMPKLK